MSIPISKMILISLLLSVYLFSQDYEQGQAKADHTQMTSNKFTKIREQMALIPEDIYFKKEAISVIEEMENSTSVQKGLAIETNGFNKVYEAKADTLNKLITPVMKNIDFTKAVSEYKSLPQEQLQNQKYYALHILDTIHSDVFSPTNKVLFPSKKDQHIITLSEALTLKNGNLLFDCDTSSFGYVETLERKFGVKKSPIVLLDCPRHMLIRWKFNDDIYINWETTAGMQPSQDKNEYYENNCIEITPGSDMFYLIFYINRGQEKNNLRDFIGAKADFYKAAKLDTQSGDAYNSLGSTKANLGDYKDAINDFDRAIELNHKNVLAYYNRGIAKSNLGDYKGAINDFNEAIKLDPEYAKAYYGRGLAKAGLKDPAHAEEDYKMAFALDYREELYNDANNIK